MSGVVHPVGPKPQAVYWRRRAVFLVVVLLTLFVIGRSVFGNSGSDNKVAAAPSSSPTTTVSPSPSATESSEPVGVESPEPEPSDAVDPITLQSPSPIVTGSQPAGSCLDSEVSVKVALKKKVVRAGAGQDIIMSVTNISNRTCKRDVGSGANEVTIISGPALVWSTDHCSPGSESNYESLKPGQTWSVKVVWNGRLSAQNCQVLADATYGAYWAHARNGALTSPGARFVVE